MTMTEPAAPPIEEPAEPDRPAVEVVDTPAAGPPAIAEKSTLELATEAALANPNIAGRDEFLMLATTARILSMSAGAPAAVRNNPWLAFHLALIGRDLGISPSAALQQIDVIGYDPDKPSDYDKVQLSLSPELLNGQIRRLGLGRIVPGARSDISCEALAMTPQGEVLGSATFTWEEARQAGLVDKRCEPFAHWVNESSPEGERWKNVNRCKCRQGYRTYPRRMLWWRAAGYAASDYFPEAGLGLYSPEELGAVVDETGRPIDPALVELPEGYEAPPPPPPPPSEDQLFGEHVPDDLVTERDDLTARLEAVKTVPPAVEALRPLWNEVDGEGYRKTPPWGHLDFRRRHLIRARALVKSIEDKIKRGEWGDEAKEAWATAAVEGAGFGTGRAPKPTAEDFQAGAGKTPHELARERIARTAAAMTAATAPVEGSESPDAGPDEALPAVEPTDVVTPPETAEGNTEPLPETCKACGEPFKTTASGKPHAGPLGRDDNWADHHRSCAPF